MPSEVSDKSELPRRAYLDRLSTDIQTNLDSFLLHHFPNAFRNIRIIAYQEEGKPAVEILPGTVIHIPAGVKHWHGAAADGWFAHLAFEIAGENASNEWLEPVTDEEYDRLQK